MTGLAQVFLFLLLAVLLGLALSSWRAARRAAALCHTSTVLAVRRMGSAQPDEALEVLCALPQGWEGHQAGQFVWGGLEGPGTWAEALQPLAIASAPGAATVEGVRLLRLVLRPRGAAQRRVYRGLCRRLQPGARLRLSGACGTALGPGRADLQQVWVADAVGLAPFMAALEARQQGGIDAGSRPVQLHYCSPDAGRDSSLHSVVRLCAQARPPVALVVHDAAQGQRLRALDLSRSGTVEVWFAGPESLGQRLRRELGAQGWAHWRFHWVALARQGLPATAAAGAEVRVESAPQGAGGRGA